MKNDQASSAIIARPRTAVSPASTVHASSSAATIESTDSPSTITTSRPNRSERCSTFRLAITRSAQLALLATRRTTSMTIATPHSTKFHGVGTQMDTSQIAAVAPL